MVDKYKQHTRAHPNKIARVEPCIEAEQGVDFGELISQHLPGKCLHLALIE